MADVQQAVVDGRNALVEMCQPERFTIDEALEFWGGIIVEADQAIQDLRAMKDLQARQSSQ